MAGVIGSFVLHESDRFDAKNETVAAENFYRCARRERCVGPRAPNFALDPDPAFTILPG